ncbi:hypothetical protein TWF281_008847 [Arthrobotrys megalospora]
MITERIINFFRRNAKRYEHGERVYSRNMMLIAPLTTAMVYVQLPPELSKPGPEEQAFDLPIAPAPALLRDSTALAGRNSTQSLMAYGQIGLAGIDAIPRPAWGPSLSAAKIHECRSQVATHYRYENLENRGIKVPTMLVGPERLNALGAYENLEARAMQEAKTSLVLMEDISDGGKSGTGEEEQSNGCGLVGEENMKTITMCRDEESLLEKEERSIPKRIKMALESNYKTGLAGLKGCLDLVRRGIHQAYLLLRPVETPVRMGFRCWLREGVDPGVNPRATTCDMQRTAPPRDWDVTLGTSVTRPCAVPREFYRDFTRDA